MVIMEIQNDMKLKHEARLGIKGLTQGFIGLCRDTAFCRVLRKVYLGLYTDVLFYGALNTGYIDVHRGITFFRGLNEG